MGKVLVTGGAGYIGSHTIVDLLDNGWEVVSIDNFLNSTPRALERIRQITGVSVTNYAVDLCDKTATARVLEQEKNIQGIIHFAALKSVPDSVRRPLMYYHNNLLSLINLMELIDLFGIKHFVFSSSCSVYGNTDALPVTENTPLGKAESPYAHTKQICEEIIRYHAVNTQVKFILLRYFNPAGAHPSGLLGEDNTDQVTAIVPRITGTAIGKFDIFTVFGNDYPTRDGSCIRDYVHVMDIARAHTLALAYLLSNTGAQQVETFNLGTGQGISVLEAIRSFEKVTQQKLRYTIGPRRSGDVVTIYADNRLAREKLGWQPRYTLDDMMRTAWEWEKNLTKR
ncbi:MAG: UDP-glucose 4-epimerase GalE [Chitinophagales bacterium]|nr:UDP-glucose 4-epimerase GalE [Chitinophagales bacterium]MDW8418261.1 UDP-glucose 4-epimerase GalE [Chitinophagales bacterium]